MGQTTLLLLGAGASRRMRGGDKLLEDVEGRAVLRLLAERGLAAGLELRVTLPSLDHPRAATLAGLDVQLIEVPDWQSGMAASIRAGVSAPLPGPVIILPGDMPEITPDDLITIASATGAIVQGTNAAGRPGHPVRFAPEYRAALMELSGDVGARDIVRRQADQITRVALPGDHAVTDLDTPEEWAAWRAVQAAH